MPATLARECSGLLAVTQHAQLVWPEGQMQAARKHKLRQPALGRRAFAAVDLLGLVAVGGRPAAAPATARCRHGPQAENEHSNKHRKIESYQWSGSAAAAVVAAAARGSLGRKRLRRAASASASRHSRGGSNGRSTDEYISKTLYVGGTGLRGT